MAGRPANAAALAVAASLALNLAYAQHPPINLFDSGSNVINPISGENDTKPFSTENTCGTCHPGGAGLESDRDGNRYDKNLRGHPELRKPLDGDYYHSNWDMSGVVAATLGEAGPEPRVLSPGYCRPQKGRDSMKFKKVSGPARFLIASAGLLALLIGWRLFSPYSLPALLDRLDSDVRNLWSIPYFRLGTLAVTPTVLVKAFVFVLFLTLLTRLSRRLIRSKVLDYTPLDEGQKFALEQVVGYLLFTFGLIMGLQSAGVNFSSLAVVGGAIGIGVGFGLQSIAKNFVSGLILLLERPIKVGDRVQVESLQGDVIHIGGRGTWVRTNDNVVMIVPNSEFIENRVTNWTANDRLVRITVPLGVSYGSDPAQVREVLLEMAHQHPDVLNTPAPDVIFIGFGESSLDFELRIWTTKQVQTPKIISSDLYYAIFKAFKDSGIEIPFPQRDLHIRSVGLRIPIDANGGERRREAPQRGS